jgi:hypothetical protein
MDLRSIGLPTGVGFDKRRGWSSGPRHDSSCLATYIQCNCCACEREIAREKGEGAGVGREIYGEGMVFGMCGVCVVCVCGQLGLTAETRVLCDTFYLGIGTLEAALLVTIPKLRVCSEKNMRSVIIPPYGMR